MAGVGGIAAPPPLRLDLESTVQSQQWDDWLAELELYFCADNITDDKRKYSVLLYLVGREVRDVYNTLGDTVKTYTSATTALNAFFSEKKNLVFERYTFNSAKQKEFESVKSFLLRLKKLASSCDFDNYSVESAIIDKFITGCVDSDLRKKLLSAAKLEMEQLVEKAVSFESVNKQAKQMEEYSGDTSEQVNALGHKPPGKCWGCGESGHVQHDSKCPASLKECRKCGFVGHFYRYCDKDNKKNKGRVINQLSVDSEDSDGEYLF